MTLATHAPVPGTGRPTPQLAEFQSPAARTSPAGRPGRPRRAARLLGGALRGLLARAAALVAAALVGQRRVALSGATSRPRGSSPTSGSTTPRRCCSRCRASTTTAPRSPRCTPTGRRALEPRRAAVRGAADLGRARRHRPAPGERVVLVAPNTACTAIVALAAAALGAPLATRHSGHGRWQRCWAASSRWSRCCSLVDRTGMADETLAGLLAGLPTLRRLLILDDCPADASCRSTDWRSSPAPRRTPRLGAAAVRLAAVRALLLGPTGPPKAMVHGVGGDAAGAREGTPAAQRHAARRRLLPPLDDCVDGLEPAPVDPRHRCAHRGLRRAGPRDRRPSGSSWPTRASPSSGRARRTCSCARTPVTARPTRSTCPGVRAVLSQGAVLEDWQYDWVADAVGPVRLCRPAAERTSSARSSSPTRAAGAARAHPDAQPGHGRGRRRRRRPRADRGGRRAGLPQPVPVPAARFLRDPDGRRFHEAYFVQNPGMWTHGDRIDFDRHGSARLHGRSDGVLNIDGLRIGPSEIYTALRRAAGHHRRRGR